MNGKRPRIVVVGSTNVDFCSYVTRLPQAGETVGNGVFMQANGGKGANQAVAAARLGGDVSFLTSIGVDSIGDTLLKHFESEGIDCSAVIRVAGASTGIALIMIDKKGENIITVNPGANAMLTSERMAAVIELVAGADAVLMQAEIPYSTVKYVARAAHDACVPVIFNPAPVCDIDDEMMTLTDIMILNRTEAAIISGSERVAEAARELLQRGVKNVVITLGSEGAYFACATGASAKIPSFKVMAVDTVGAGDTFCGAFAVAYAQRKAVDVESLQFASAAAAISVTHKGAQSSIPLLEETLSFISGHYELTADRQV